MRISHSDMMEIVSSFQRLFKDKPDAEKQVESYCLADLKQADEMLGDRDTKAGFRIAMRNRIATLEKDELKVEQEAALIEQRSYESNIRIWNLVTGLVIGVAVGIVVGVTLMWLS